MEQIRRIMRPTDVPDTGLLCDLLWSDPDKDVKVSEKTSPNQVQTINRPTFSSTGLGRKRSRRELHLRRRRGFQVLEYARSGPDLPGAPGRRGRVRVLRQTLAGHALLRSQLLRRVRQRRWHDVGRRESNVFISGEYF